MTLDYNISRLRVFFTLYIVLYHSVDNYFLKNPSIIIHSHEELEFLRGITNFALQGFVFISGLLMARGYLLSEKYRDKKQFLFDKAKRLLVPYTAWGVVLVALYPVSWVDVLCGAKHLWFLLMLFDVMVLAAFVFPLLEKSSKLIDISFFFTVILLSTLLQKYVNLPNVFSWKTAFSFLPPYLIGAFLVKYGLDEKLVKINKNKFYSLLSFVMVIAVVFLFIHSLPLGLFYMHLPNFILIPLLYVLFRRLYGTAEISPVLRSIDKNSLGIYILHNFVGKYTFLYYVPSFVAFYNKHCVLAPFCLFILMFSLAWFVSFMMHKNKYSASLLGS